MLTVTQIFCGTPFFAYELASEPPSLFKQDEASIGKIPMVLVGNDTNLLVMFITLGDPSYSISVMVKTDPVVLHYIPELQGKYKKITERSPVPALFPLL
ncbi:hypothetical protein E2C01_078189 [Portunus trituberculatus]|uniref:Uncharacterized protein n=1 Tax=Portunus trituberculatus TaxID=210409 RepID=A0A5B7IPI4_PORTR|nr:hypothetical protein [Portunus trituberculatus]